MLLVCTGLHGLCLFTLATDAERMMQQRSLKFGGNDLEVFPLESIDSSYSCALVVQGITEASHITDDVLVLIFENQRFGRDYRVESVKMLLNSAVVTMDTPEGDTKQ